MEDVKTGLAIETGEVSKWWWVWLVLGILWVVASLLILQFDSASLTAVGAIIGLMLIVLGIQDFLIAIASEGWKWIWVIFGVIFVIAGIIALVFPKNTFSAVADMLGFLFLLIGVFWMIEAFAVKPENELWWFNLIAGILMVMMAFWTAGQFWITKAYTLLTFAGIWALAQGILDIVKAFQIKKLGSIKIS